jgi:hypothetical protein
MPAPIIVDPKHWLACAARMQALAVKMAGSRAAILMNDLAIHYEELADQAPLKISRRQTDIGARRKNAAQCRFRAAPFD